MRFVRWVLALFMVAAVIAAIAAWVFLVPYGPHQETFVDIAPGTSTAGMAAQLKQAGIIRSQTAFEAMKLVHGGVLKAGEYRFDHPAKLAEVYSRLRKGDVYTLTLVVPEGYNIFDIAEAVEKTGLGKREDFLAAERKHTELIAQWAPGATSLEGHLFPDTYRFSRHTTTLTMLSTMVKRFEQVAGRLGLDQADTERTVVLASLVEKEVHNDAERPLVAGVFENRLRAGMPLQTDPAVIYASMLRGTWTGVIHQSELRSDSPYNTYTHAGLPPGPICNPGMAALRSAMHPVKTDDLYFAADAHGATLFARTLEEHLANVAKYRAAEK